MQLLAKFKKILHMGFRATLVMQRILLVSHKNYYLSISNFDKIQNRTYIMEIIIITKIDK